jgi:hypothetical protein
LIRITAAEVEQLQRALAATPRRIASLSRGVETGRLNFKPDDDSWSANEVLAHLRACADVWGKSIMAMITQDHPTLRYISPRGWIRKTNYTELEFSESLTAFTLQRRDLLKALKGLSAVDWSPGATFTAT